MTPRNNIRLDTHFTTISSMQCYTNTHLETRISDYQSFVRMRHTPRFFHQNTHQTLQDITLGDIHTYIPTNTVPIPN